MDAFSYPKGRRIPWKLSVVIEKMKERRVEVKMEHVVIPGSQSVGAQSENQSPAVEMLSQKQHITFR